MAGQVVTGVASALITKLLLVGAAAMAIGSGAPLRILTKDCEPPEPPKTDEAALALARRFQAAGIAAANAIGGEEALGPAPSVASRVSDFAGAWMTELLFTLAPGCMENLGVPRDVGAEANEFGADLTEWDPDVTDWLGEEIFPPAVRTVIETLMLGITIELELRGYAVDRSAAAEDTENPIGDALVELLVRQRTQLAVRVAGAHQDYRHRGRAQTMRRR